MPQRTRHPQGPLLQHHRPLYPRPRSITTNGPAKNSAEFDRSESSTSIEFAPSTHANPSPAKKLPALACNGQMNLLKMIVCNLPR